MIEYIRLIIGEFGTRERGGVGGAAGRKLQRRGSPEDATVGYRRTAVAVNRAAAPQGIHERLHERSARECLR